MTAYGIMKMNTKYLAQYPECIVSVQLVLLALYISVYIENSNWTSFDERSYAIRKFENFGFLTWF